MKALSLTQPWATLVALGEKTIETRSWQTSYRGPLLIHAAKAFPMWCREMCDTPPFREVLRKHGLGASDLPRGVLLCEVNFHSIIPTEGIIGNPKLFSSCEHEIMFGNYSDGRYGFLLSDLQPYGSPIVAKGALGIWEWSAA